MHEFISPLMQFHKDHGDCKITLSITVDIIRIATKGKHIDFKIREIAYTPEKFASFGDILRLLSNSIST